jgi:hypothetical protein
MVVVNIAHRIHREKMRTVIGDAVLHKGWNSLRIYRPEYFCLILL